MIEFPDQIDLDTSALKTFPGEHSSLRRDYESPLHRFPTSDSEDETDPFGQPPPNQLPNELNLPAFARNLVTLMRGIGLDPFGDNFDFIVRTWNLNHFTIKQWFAPRIFSLQGPPETWENQISSAWIDILDENECFDVHVALPDPPRPPRHAMVQMDLIISQDFQIPRFAGLVTVVPLQSQTDEGIYSVAVSCPLRVSGRFLIS